MRLTKSARSNIPSSEFAGTKPGTFPIEDEAHAKAAIGLSGNDPHPAAVKAKAEAKLRSIRGATNDRQEY